MFAFDRKSLVCVIAAVGTLSGARAAFADPATAENVAAFNVRLADKDAARAVRLAVAGAHGRLGRERCMRIFEAFRDPSGETLNQNLATLGSSGQEFLARVLFYDGSGLAVCQPSPAREVYAFTARGSRVVYVCARQFQAKQRKSPVLAEVVVIHEVLHALGLGEAPPSSDEITWRVTESCAR
jgi:hypothetical protein